MTDFRGLLSALRASGTEFIVVGGVAATLHGSARLTSDLDVVCARGEGTLFGLPVRVLDLPTLIRTKRAAGRPRDFEALAELEALERERREPQA